MSLGLKFSSFGSRWWNDQLARITDQLMDDLKLRGTYWEEIDPYLFLIAFTTAGMATKFPDKLRYFLLENYGMIHHEKFEFYGDRIISAINATQLLVNDYHSIGKIINIAGQNKVFICLMKNKNLCRGFFHNKPLRGKSCADTFEAIIGLLYWYLEKTYGSRFDTLQYVEQWLNSARNPDKILSEVANNRPACIPKNKQIVPPEPLFSEPLTIWQSLDSPDFHHH